MERVMDPGAAAAEKEPMRRPVEAANPPADADPQAPRNTLATAPSSTGGYPGYHQDPYMSVGS